MARVLAVVAHPDDESLGCGATLAKHIAAGDAVSVLVLADGVSSRGFSVERIKERHGQCRAACKLLGTEDVWIHAFPDNQMDKLPLLQVVQHVELNINRFKPDVVYTHDASDLNVDHRITCEAVRVACRPQPGQCVKWLLHFEVPCSSAYGMGFQPDYFSHVDEFMEAKVNACRQYPGELHEPPHPRSLSGVVRLAELRGSAVGVKFAEAFRLGRALA
jgi:LmbE family N-acetylglucosaminyl deacetylase